MNEPSNPAPPTVPTAPISTVTVSPHTKATLSTTESETMTGWLKQDLAQGRISPEQAQKAFDQLGASQEARLPDARSDEEKQMDQVFGMAAKESDFNPIQYYPPGQTPAIIPKEVAAFDASARGWMVDAGLSAENGNSLVTHISHALQETHTMTDDQLEGYRQTELTKLQAAHGEKLPERLALADDMIDLLEQQRPGLRDLLEKKGIGRSAMVWNLLIQAATPYHARRKGR